MDIFLKALRLFVYASKYAIGWTVTYILLRFEKQVKWFMGKLN